MINIITAVKKRKYQLTFDYYCKLLVFWFFLVFCTFYLLKTPERGGESVRSALSVCAGRLIPSLFPFAVLVNMICNSGLPSVLAKLVGKHAARVFRINDNAVCALILGILGGFPIGAVCVGDLYKRGIINERDAGRLSAAVSVASPAFCIGAVGSMFPDGNFGLRLYFCQLFAAMFILFVTKGTPQGMSVVSVRRPVSAARILTDAVSAGGITMVKICSFVIFFAVIGDGVCAATEAFLGAHISAAVASFFEITLAVRKSVLLPSLPAMLVTAFAVGYSGLSVHMQIFSVLGDCRISKADYLIRRLLQGILTAVFMYISFLFV